MPPKSGAQAKGRPAAASLRSARAAAAPPAAPAAVDADAGEARALLTALLKHNAVEDLHSWVAERHRALDARIRQLSSALAVADVVAPDARADAQMRASQELSRRSLMLVEPATQLASEASIAPPHAAAPPAATARPPTPLQATADTLPGRPTMAAPLDAAQSAPSTNVDTAMQPKPDEVAMRVDAAAAAGEVRFHSSDEDAAAPPATSSTPVVVTAPTDMPIPVMAPPAAAAPIAPVRSAEEVLATVSLQVRRSGKTRGGMLDVFTAMDRNRAGWVDAADLVDCMLLLGCDMGRSDADLLQQAFRHPSRHTGVDYAALIDRIHPKPTVNTSTTALRASAFVPPPAVNAAHAGGLDKKPALRQSPGVTAASTTRATRPVSSSTRGITGRSSGSASASARSSRSTSRRPSVSNSAASISPRPADGAAVPVAVQPASTHMQASAAATSAGDVAVAVDARGVLASPALAAPSAVHAAACFDGMEAYMPVSTTIEVNGQRSSVQLLMPVRMSHAGPLPGIMPATVLPNLPSPPPLVATAAPSTAPEAEQSITAPTAALAVASPSPDAKLCAPTAPASAVTDTQPEESKLESLAQLRPPAPTALPPSESTRADPPQPASTDASSVRALTSTIAPPAPTVEAASAPAHGSIRRTRAYQYGRLPWSSVQSVPAQVPVLETLPDHPMLRALRECWDTLSDEATPDMLWCCADAAGACFSAEQLVSAAPLVSESPPTDMPAAASTSAPNADVARDHTAVIAPRPDTRPDMAIEPQSAVAPVNTAAVVKEPAAAVQSVEPVQAPAPWATSELPITARSVATMLDDHRAEQAAASTSRQPSKRALLDHTPQPPPVVPSTSIGPTEPTQRPAEERRPAVIAVATSSLPSHAMDEMAHLALVNGLNSMPGPLEIVGSGLMPPSRSIQPAPTPALPPAEKSLTAGIPVNNVGKESETRLIPASRAPEATIRRGDQTTNDGPVVTGSSLSRGPSPSRDLHSARHPSPSHGAPSAARPADIMPVAMSKAYTRATADDWRLRADIRAALRMKCRLTNPDDDGSVLEEVAQELLRMGLARYSVRSPRASLAGHKSRVPAPQTLALFDLQRVLSGLGIDRPDTAVSTFLARLQLLQQGRIHVAAFVAFIAGTHPPEPATSARPPEGVAAAPSAPSDMIAALSSRDSAAAPADAGVAASAITTESPKRANVARAPKSPSAIPTAAIAPALQSLSRLAASSPWLGVDGKHPQKPRYSITWPTDLSRDALFWRHVNALEDDVMREVKRRATVLGISGVSSSKAHASLGEANTLLQEVAGAFILRRAFEFLDRRSVRSVSIDDFHATLADLRLVDPPSRLHSAATNDALEVAAETMKQTDARGADTEPTLLSPSRATRQAEMEESLALGSRRLVAAVFRRLHGEGDAGNASRVLVSSTTATAQLEDSDPVVSAPLTYNMFTRWAAPLNTKLRRIRERIQDAFRAYATLGGGAKDYQRGFVRIRAAQHHGPGSPLRKAASPGSAERSVTPTQFRSVLGSVVRTLSDSEMQTLIDFYDRDGDGQIDFAEFLGIVNTDMQRIVLSRESLHDDGDAAADVTFVSDDGVNDTLAEAVREH